MGVLKYRESVGSEWKYVSNTGTMTVDGTPVGPNEPATGLTWIDTSVEANASEAGISMELLWENASPTSEFAAQDIAVDLSDYQQARIVFMYQAYHTPDILPALDVEIGLPALTSYAGVRNMGRSCRVYTDRVSFGNGHGYTTYGNSSNTAMNDHLVPWQIYGIKGVQV